MVTLITALAMVAALMASLRTCSERQHHADAAAPAGGDTLDVAIEYGPLTLYRYADTLGGLSYDMLRVLGDSLGRPLQFHPVTTAEGAMAGLAEGRYDIVAASLPSMSADSASGVSLLEPVYLDRLVLVQLRDSAGNLPVNNQLELAGRQVWVTAHSPAARRLHNLAAEIGDTIHIIEDPAYGAEQLLIMVATADIPLAVVSQASARALAGQYPRLDTGTAVSFTQFHAWSARTSDSLLRRDLDSAIVRLKRSEPYRELLRRYDTDR